MESLYEILNKTTQVYRKGDLISEKKLDNVNIVEIYNYPALNKNFDTKLYEKVDMIFVDVLVDKIQAEKYKTNLENVLKNYSEPKRLSQGPSYIELAPNLGLEQEGGLRVMALGKVLGLWNIMSGKTLGMDDDQSLQMAELGLLNISGYKK
jgi:hypothetical protein